MGPILPFIIPDPFSNKSISYLVDINGHVWHSTLRVISTTRMDNSEQKMLNCGTIILSNALRNSWRILLSRESNATHLRKYTRM